jgi:AraC-like DNA-binding protein
VIKDASSSKTRPTPPPPAQKRSRETLERVLAAAEKLLEEHLFEQVAMTDVARLAGVFVGTIHTRFADVYLSLPCNNSRHPHVLNNVMG